MSYLTGSISNLFLDRKDVAEQLDLRQSRSAIILLKDDCTWTIPSALEELNDYDSLFVTSYEDVDKNEMLQDIPKGTPFNVYFNTWGVGNDEIQDNIARATEAISQIYSDSHLEYLWDAPYSIVYQCVSME